MKKLIVILIMLFTINVNAQIVKSVVRGVGFGVGVGIGHDLYKSGKDYVKKHDVVNKIKTTKVYTKAKETTNKIYDKAKAKLN